jgi:hypothetical protein
LTEIFFWPAARIMGAHFVVGVRCFFCRVTSDRRYFRRVERSAGSARFANKETSRAK